MRFEWDERKRTENIRKHGLDFRDAHFVFAGPAATWADAREDYGEDRWITLGILGSMVVFVVFTEPGRTLSVYCR